MDDHLKRIARQMANANAGARPREGAQTNLPRTGFPDPRVWREIRTAEHWWLRQQKQNVVPPLSSVDESLARIPSVRLPTYRVPESLNNLIDASRVAGSYLAQINEMVERVAQTMAEPMARIADISRAVARPIQGWAQLVNNIPSSWNFDGFWEGLRPVIRDVQILIEDANAGREVLRENEFGFADHFWGIFYVRGFAHIPERVRPAVVTTKLMSFTSSESFAGEIGDAICKSRLMRGRWPIVEAICEAHASRNYALAVPASLAQIEGTLVDLMFLKDLVKREDGRFYLVDENGDFKCNRKNKRLGPVTLGPAITSAKLAEHPNLAATSEFIANTIVQRRNDVLHGRDLGYAKAKFSVQAMLLLAVLSEAVARMESGEIV